MTGLRISALSTLLACVLLGAQSVPADTVFSNLGPGDIYISDSSSDHFVKLGSIFYPDAVAAPFAVGPSDYLLNTAELGLQHVNGTNGLNVRLFSDSAGLPGTSLASTTVSGMPEYDGSLGSHNVSELTTASFGSSITLTANTKYWLEVDASGDEFAGWLVTPFVDQVGVAYHNYFQSGTWTGYEFASPAFRINGTLPDVTPVPLPNTAAAGLALLSCLGLIKLHHRASAV